MEHACGCIEVWLTTLWKVVLHPGVTLDECIRMLEAELAVTILELTTVSIAVHPLASLLRGHLIVLLCLWVVSAIL